MASLFSSPAYLDVLSNYVSQVTKTTLNSLIRMANLKTHLNPGQKQTNCGRISKQSSGSLASDL